MDDDFFRREYDAGPQKRDNLFAWTIFILLLTGAVLACWLGSFYVFGHPENPGNYKILAKLHKIEPPRRFIYTEAPPGEFLTPQKIYEKYSTMPEYELQEANSGFLRDFIRNYQTAKSPVPYLVGRFPIINSRELSSRDMFPSGVIALAQAADYPQVLVEYIYTTLPSGVEQVKETLAPGIEIKSEKTNDLSAVLHIEKLQDGRLLLTVVPINYPTYTLKQGSGIFSLDPPATLHLEGGVPLTKLSTIPVSSRNYALVRPSATPTDGGDIASAPASSPTNEELVRVIPPLALATPKSSGHGAPPPPRPVTVATPVPAPVVAQATPVPAPTVEETPPPAPIAQMTPPPAPIQATPPPTFAQNITPVPFSPNPAMSPEPATTAMTPAPSVAANNPNVPLQPFIEVKATPAITTAAGSWKVFRPGQMPRGRLLKVSDAAGLADRGTGGERLYLSGQFVVTASGENRAVLRAKGGVLNALNPLEHSNNSTRILVEFPAGYQPPTEGSTISRDEMRPFEILDVQRERDGTVDVSVREITTPE